MATLKNQLKQYRQHSGLGQGVVAARAGISRQTLSSLENGASEPSMAVALRLARALECGVEELFALDDEGSLLVDLAEAGKEVSRGSRVVLGEVAGRWVAHPLAPGDEAAFAVRCDALVEGTRGRKARVRPLESRSTLEQNTILCGCDPALGILAGRAQRDGARFIWIPSPSQKSLEAITHGDVHIAGLHLLDEESGEYNAPFVQRARPDNGRRLMVVTLAHVMAGLVVAKGNPLRITNAADFARTGAKIVNREEGAGARRLLDRLLRNAGMRGRDVPGYRNIARGHLHVAQEVATGNADVGVATESAAIAHGCSFVPLAEERFDLALSAEMANEPRIAAVLDALQSRSFRRELQSVGGYDASESGQIVSETRSA